MKGIVGVNILLMLAAIAMVSYVGLNGASSTGATVTCIDSDNGQNIYVKGTCNGKSYGSDSCYTSTAVKEFSCARNGFCQSTNINCPAGYTCFDGACVAKTTTTTTTTTAPTTTTTTTNTTTSIVTSTTTTATSTLATTTTMTTSTTTMTTSTSQSSSAITFSKIASLPASRSILTTPSGIDFNNNGKKEFVLRAGIDTSGASTTFNVYDGLSGNTFANVASLTTESGNLVSYYPADVGDSDNDTKKELLVYGRTDNNFYTRLYEAPTASGYPSIVSWQTQTGWWTVGARIDDLDGDGKKEIVFAGQDSDGHKVQVYENAGDNSYNKVYSAIVPDFHTSQCFDTMNDLDGDGKKEMIFGGLTAGSAFLHMYENTGDNSFSEIWSFELKYSDGNPLNCAKVVFAGDMDGDGKKEFVVGGLRSAPLGTPVIAVYYVFEANGDNTFQKVAEITKPMDLLGDTSVNVADLDGDGKNEIIITTENSAAQDGVYVFKATGDNQFTEVWNHTWSRPGTVAQWLDTIGVGDVDGDGKPEVIFNEYNGAVNTVVYEKS